MSPIFWLLPIHNPLSGAREARRGRLEPGRAIRPGAGGVAEEHVEGFRRLRGFDPGRRGMPGDRCALSPICRPARAGRPVGRLNRKWVTVPGFPGR